MWGRWGRGRSVGELGCGGGASVGRDGKHEEEGEVERRGSKD